MPTALITGSNRGLGLEFVRRLSGRGWRVHACARVPERARDLKALEGEILRHRLDVTDGLQIAGLGRELADEPIDLLVNNAGIIGPRGGFGHIAYEDWLQVFNVNTLAPMRVAETFARHLEKSERPRLVNISSRLGSIAENATSGSHIYRSSKAALNMVTKCLSIDLHARGIVVVAMHPGWVSTAMGGRDAPLDPRGSVESMLGVIDGLTLENSGGFFDQDGATIPW